LDHAADICLHSSNQTVLLKISEALAFASCDHVCAQDVQVQLRTIARSLSEKFMTLSMEPDDNNAYDDVVSLEQREKSKSKARRKKEEARNQRARPMRRCVPG
jgi:hypothetical protein